jgi:DNA polymerase-3 subunit epsilon
MTLDTVLIADLETSGLSPDTDRTVEIGMVIYSIKHRSIVRASSLLLAGEGNAAEDVNGIPAALLADREAGVVTPEEGWSVFRAMAEKASCVVAHNASFDESFVPISLRAMKPWCCTCHHVPWPSASGATSNPLDYPRSRPGKSLVALCLEWGVGVSHAHRALTDCLLIARLFDRVAERGHDVAALLALGLRPRARFVANVPRERNDELKAAGFKWNPDRSQWWRDLVREDAYHLPFPVKESA